MLYSGKAQCLGLKSTPPSPAASTSAGWRELSLAGAGRGGPASVVGGRGGNVGGPVRIVHCSVGHDGEHGLLVADDGAVYFVGVARRGEDGESAASLGQWLHISVPLN